MAALMKDSRAVGHKLIDLIRGAELESQRINCHHNFSQPEIQFSLTATAQSRKR